MGKFAAVLQKLEPVRIGTPRKLDQLDDDDRQAIIDRYAAGCSVGQIRRELASAGFEVSAQPVIDLLRTANVYRGR